MHDSVRPRRPFRVVDSSSAALVASLFAYLSAAGAAQAQTNYGHWSVAQGDDKTYIYASTMNDSGAILGEYCYYASKRCFWLLGNSTACEKEHIYPTLANSDTGAIELDISCNGEVKNGIYGYSFTKWQDLENVLKKASRGRLCGPP